MPLDNYLSDISCKKTSKKRYTSTCEKFLRLKTLLNTMYYIIFVENWKSSPHNLSTTLAAHQKLLNEKYTKLNNKLKIKLLFCSVGQKSVACL